MKPAMRPVRPRTILIVPLTLLAAYLAWRDAAIFWQLDASPRQAIAPLRDDPRIGAARADPARLYEGTMPGKELGTVAAAAQRTLRSAPLQPTAIWQLAMVAEKTAPKAAAARLALAEKVSQRDMMTQLTLMRKAAQRGDGRTAFRHLDTALTVNPEVGPLVFPQLAGGLGDAELRRMLPAYGARPWFSAFLAAAVEAARNPREVAALVPYSTRATAQDKQALLSPLLTQLLEAGEHDKAVRLAASVGGVAPATLADFRLSAQTTEARFAPLTWRLASDDGAFAALVEDDMVEIEVEPGKAAVALERFTALPPGKYWLEQTIEAPDGGRLRAAWELACRGPHRESPAWQQAIDLRETATRYRSPLAIPAGCARQDWRLKVSAFDSPAPVILRVSRLRLSPSSAAPGRDASGAR